MKFPVTFVNIFAASLPNTGHKEMLVLCTREDAAIFQTFVIPKYRLWSHVCLLPWAF